MTRPSLDPAQATQLCFAAHARYAELDLVARMLQKTRRHRQATLRFWDAKQPQNELYWWLRYCCAPRDKTRRSAQAPDTRDALVLRMLHEQQTQRPRELTLREHLVLGEMTRRWQRDAQAVSRRTDLSRQGRVLADACCTRLLVAQLQLEDEVLARWPAHAGIYASPFDVGLEQQRSLDHPPADEECLAAQAHALYAQVREPGYLRATWRASMRAWVRAHLCG